MLAPFFSQKFAEISRKDFLSLLPLGIPSLIGTLSYAVAIHLGDISILNVLVQLTIVFTVIGGWLFLKEKIGWKQMLGIICALVGAIVLTLS